MTETLLVLGILVLGIILLIEGVVILRWRKDIRDSPRKVKECIQRIKKIFREYLRERKEDLDG